MASGEPIDDYQYYWDYVYAYDFASSNLTLGNLTNITYDVYDASAIPDNAPDGRLVVAIFSLIFLVGVPGNTLVVYVVSKNGAMKTVTNLYLVNLAIADLLFLTLCITFTGSAYVMSWPFGNAICKLVNYLMVVTMGVSVLTLAAMCIDRYYAITKPIRSKMFSTESNLDVESQENEDNKPEDSLHGTGDSEEDEFSDSEFPDEEDRSSRTIRRTTIKLLSIWGLTMMSQISVAVISQTVEYWDKGQERKYCVEKFADFRYRQAYTLLVFGILFVAPFGIIAICYLRMSKFLLNSVRPGETQLTTGTANALKSRRKVALMMLVVTLVFGLCWLPLHVVYLKSDFGPSGYSAFFDYFKVAAHCLSYANSAVNPLIYCFMSKHFRQCFKMALPCKSTAQQTLPVADPEALQIPLFPRRRQNSDVHMRINVDNVPERELQPPSPVHENEEKPEQSQQRQRRNRLDTMSTST